VVEEHIIDNIGTPRSERTIQLIFFPPHISRGSPFQSDHVPGAQGQMLLMLPSSDSFRRLDSLDEMESFATSLDHPVAFSTRPRLSTESLVGLGQDELDLAGTSLSPPRALSNLDVRRRAKSLPGELASSCLPDDHLIPSTMKIVSPLKDISRSKHLFSATELSLPLTIGSTNPTPLSSSLTDWVPLQCPTGYAGW
jgi:hypothetical protein